jgi:hypothetical protein
MNFGTSCLTRMRIAPILLLTGQYNKCFIADRLPNMTFCGPARDTVLTNRQTEKLNFDTNYIYVVYRYKLLLNHKYSLALITPRIFSCKMLYFD